jgi:fructose-1,6-bisphosphatase/inositol monophosphatase family enzyme
MVREAGGLATDATGGSDMFGSGTIVCGAPQIQRGLLELIRS